MSGEEAENGGHRLQLLSLPPTTGEGGYAATQTQGAWILNPLGLSLHELGPSHKHLCTGQEKGSVCFLFRLGNSVLYLFCPDPPLPSSPLPLPHTIPMQPTMGVGNCLLKDS